ncbi:MAG: RNA polymerase sigma-70 factor [Mariniphaga sp.]|nr:RNA polymerase sigma-70 factor [Mariniphaga sp.]
MFSIETKRELQKGNPDAFKEVFRLLYPRLKGYCKLFVPDQKEVEDLIQECFITLWDIRETIDVQKRLESFLFVIIRNKCLNFLKSQKLDSENIPADNLQIAELQHLYQLDLAEKEEKSLEEMLIQTFQESVNTLPEKMKEVFIKCKLEGKKQKEVAEEMGISIKMVEKQIAKAKKQIREQLLKKYPAMVVLIAMLLG